MRAIGFAAVASTLIVTAPISAAADDQTITASFSVTVPPSVVASSAGGTFELASSTPFPFFEPTTGTLDSVSTIITGSLSWASIAENPNVRFTLFDPTRESLFGDALFTTVGTLDLNLPGSTPFPRRFCRRGKHERFPRICNG